MLDHLKYQLDEMLTLCGRKPHKSRQRVRRSDNVEFDSVAAAARSVNVSRRAVLNSFVSGDKVAGFVWFPIP